MMRRLSEIVRNQNIKTRLIVSFLLVTCCTFLTGYAGWEIATKLSDHIYAVGEIHLPSMYHIMNMNKQLEHIRIAQMILLDAATAKEERLLQYEIIATAQKEYKNSQRQYRGSVKTVEEQTQFKKLEAMIDAWESENNKFIELSKSIDSIDVANPIELKKNLEQFRGDLYKLKSEVSYFIQTNHPFDGGENPHDSNFGRWISTFQTNNQDIKKIIADLDPLLSQFYAATAKIKQQVPLGQIQAASLTFFTEMIPAAEKMFACFDMLLSKANEAEALFTRLSVQGKIITYAEQAKTASFMQEILNTNHAATDASVISAAQSAHWAKTNALVGCVMGTFTSLLFGILLSFTLTGKLNRFITAFKHESDQLFAVSGIISSGNCNLAEDSSQQAVRIEEASSSLEEMGGIILRNAACAQEVNSIMNQVVGIVAAVDQNMAEMGTAIREINFFGEESSKIIKTINDIAVQTNLLAINAAIEAAHAGAAGEGFAVVAGEVRKLAQSAGTAANNTSELIKKIISAVNRGDLITRTAQKSFNECRDIIRDVERLVHEITSASHEQKLSIEQIYGIIGQADQQMQQNVANAQQAAKVAHALRSQSHRITQIAQELMLLTRGGTTHKRNKLVLLSPGTNPEKSGTCGTAHAA